MMSTFKLTTLLPLILLIITIVFASFVIIKSNPAGIIQTAHCLAVKEPSTGWLSHIIQFIYRMIFETCDHDYR